MRWPRWPWRPRLDRAGATLSTGERQRIELTSTLHANTTPEVTGRALDQFAATLARLRAANRPAGPAEAEAGEMPPASVGSRDGMT